MGAVWGPFGVRLRTAWASKTRNWWANLRNLMLCHQKIFYLGSKNFYLGSKKFILGKNHQIVFVFVYFANLLGGRLGDVCGSSGVLRGHLLLAGFSRGLLLGINLFFLFPKCKQGNSLGTTNALNATKEMVWGPMVPQMQAGI